MQNKIVFALVSLLTQTVFASALPVPAPGNFPLANLIAVYDLVKCSNPNFEYKVRPSIFLDGSENEFSARTTDDDGRVGPTFSIMFQVNKGPQRDSRSELTTYTTNNGIFLQEVRRIGFFKNDTFQEIFSLDNKGILKFEMNDIINSDKSTLSHVDCTFTRTNKPLPTVY